MKHLLLLMSLLLVVACQPDNTELPGPVATSAPPLPPPATPDVGDIGQFHNCTAQPRRELSAREACEVVAFRSRCTALDDCYVSCISSPAGSFVGGRCAHVCTMGPHQGAPPPKALASCATVAGRSGVDVE
jgi:hypothetical protein